MQASPQSCRLYVGNLDKRIREIHILKLFKPFGKITKLEFLFHTTGALQGEPRGFMFLEYSTPQEAQKATQQLHGKSLMGRNLIVRFASSKEQQEAETKAEEANRNKTATQKLLEDAKNKKISHTTTFAKKANTSGAGRGASPYPKKPASTEAKVFAIQTKLKLMECEMKGIRPTAAILQSMEVPSTSPLATTASSSSSSTTTAVFSNNKRKDNESPTTATSAASVATSEK